MLSLAIELLSENNVCSICKSKCNMENCTFYLDTDLCKQHLFQQIQKKSKNITPDDPKVSKQ